MGRLGNYKESELGVKHVTIWCKPSQWDRLQYLAAPTGKAVSRYICDTVFNYSGKVEPLKKDNAESGKVYPLCVAENQWEEIQKKAKKNGMTTSKYVLAVCLN